MRPRSSLALIATVTGCNWVYGLGEVRPADAKLFDAPPPMCPAPGTLPLFDHSDLRVIIAQGCNEYTRSVGNQRALATCGGQISEGFPDQMLDKAPGDIFDLATYTIPRISADGAFATIKRGTSPNAELVLLHRDDSMWTPVSTIVTGGVNAVSEPTDEPRHVLVETSANTIIELVENGDTWSSVGTPIQQPSGASAAIHMSSDGLRMWFEGTAFNSPVSYWDRASIDGQFHALGPLDQTEGFRSPFITPDCSGIYFTSLNRVWFARRAP